MKALLIIALVLAFIIGGLLVLRSSAKTGLPSDELIKRAQERERRLEAQEKREDGES